MFKKTCGVSFLPARASAGDPRDRVNLGRVLCLRLIKRVASSAKGLTVQGWPRTIDYMLRADSGSVSWWSGHTLDRVFSAGSAGLKRSLATSVEADDSIDLSRTSGVVGGRCNNAEELKSNI